MATLCLRLFLKTNGSEWVYSSSFFTDDYGILSGNTHVPILIPTDSYLIQLETVKAWTNAWLSSLVMPDICLSICIFESVRFVNIHKNILGFLTWVVMDLISVCYYYDLLLLDHLILEPGITPSFQSLNNDFCLLCAALHVLHCIYFPVLNYSDVI